ncbi:MAG: Nif3-like dinuclear metal center hexameric protein, partial [Rikenella sp.]|nr:Nif3-like dinuclear metal center hexameric protein [Rikenella sp.]
MTLDEVIAGVEAVAPVAWQEEWDNCGWQIVDRDPKEIECSGVLLSLDVTEAVVEQAVREGANLIVCHHPLLFRGVKRLTGATAVERIVAEAVRQRVAIYAAHTNMDVAPGGVNDRLARILGLEKTEVLVPGAQAGVGLGRVGELAEAVPTGEFLTRIARLLGVPSLRHSELATETVRRVALCGGSGGEFVPQALAAGAQLYLTADLKY